MRSETEERLEQVDPAAVFAAATSLWQTCRDVARDTHLDLSDCYSGMDGLMREAMRVATLFETWSCQNIVFEELSDVWPYLLEDKFGRACFETVLPDGLADFDESECLRLALRLCLPIRVNEKLRVPLRLQKANPVAGSEFRAFRIQTFRRSIEDGDVEVFALEDEPFDEAFEAPYFSLYGINQDRHLEHIADRDTYSEIFNLVTKLAPGIEFPSTPTLVTGLK